MAMHRVAAIENGNSQAGAQGVRLESIGHVGPRLGGI